MPKPTPYGLKVVRTGQTGQAIVVLHGIRQVRESLEPFARMIADATHRDLYVYGYNHTLGLERNGRNLFDTLASELPDARLDLVGYSMGGLVARLAASTAYPSRVRTVVTLATPNRGSVSNAELTTLGQLGRSVFEFVSPFAPRTEGVKDLTRAAAIMSARRDAVLAQHSNLILNASERRYASIPGLFYNEDVADTALGPSVVLSGLQAAIQLTGLQVRLSKMQRSHDGIVTERSNDISTSETHDWSEVHLAVPAPDGTPARTHAVMDNCRQHDHLSILADADIARLIAVLIDTDDWRTLRHDHVDLHQRVRLLPFDAE
jgi:pimeloyl-ACP methyl ester carboxylesterase